MTQRNQQNREKRWIRVARLAHRDLEMLCVKHAVDRGDIVGVTAPSDKAGSRPVNVEVVAQAARPALTDGIEEPPAGRHDRRQARADARDAQQRRRGSRVRGTGSGGGRKLREHGFSWFESPNVNRCLFVAHVVKVIMIVSDFGKVEQFPQRLSAGDGATSPTDARRGVPWVNRAKRSPATTHKCVSSPRRRPAHGAFGIIRRSPTRRHVRQNADEHSEVWSRRPIPTPRQTQPMRVKVEASPLLHRVLHNASHRQPWSQASLLGMVQVVPLAARQVAERRAVRLKRHRWLL